MSSVSAIVSKFQKEVTKITDRLSALQKELTTELAKHSVVLEGGDAPVAAPAKKPRAATAWARWIGQTHHLAHPEEFETFKGTLTPEMKGPPLMLFAKHWRDTHADEYAAFIAAPAPSPPASVAPSAPASDASGDESETPAKKEKKPRAKLTEEQKAARKVAAAEKKAAKAAEPVEVKTDEEKPVEAEKKVKVKPAKAEKKSKDD